MPTVESLIAAQRAAVKELEQEERNLHSVTEQKEVLQEVLTTAWHAAVGGVAIAHASDDPGFRAVLTEALDQRVTGNRKRKLFERWKAAGTEKTSPKPAVDATVDPKSDGKATRQRRAEMRRELETLSPDELVGKFTKVEADQQQALESVAHARTKKEEASGGLRSRDRQWRVDVGLSVLAHAVADADFRSTLDKIFTQRIADKDRALLARWREQRAARTAPPKTDDAPPDSDGVFLGWVPRKLPDKSWGAMRRPPGKDLPADLVGRAIEVTPRIGDPWVTTVVEVVEKDDDSILVRHAGHPGFPSPGGNTPASPKTDDGGDGGDGGDGSEET